MITSAHSKSSHPSGFNPILQKLYEMICEIIVSKTICGIYLIFYRSSFINNFMAKNNFLEPKNHQKLNVSKYIYFRKISAYRFVGLVLSVQISWKYIFFWKKFFQGLGAFFKTAKQIIWASFFHKKIILYFFFQGWLFNFNITSKTCFKNLFGKTVKKWWFYCFK